jgi:hypothetical protein
MMVRLFFAAGFALVCWRASLGIAAPLRVYRDGRDGRALAIAGAWTMLCVAAGGTSLYLLVTA